MEYVSRVCLDVEGQEITDFEEFEEVEVELFKEVELMDKVGVAEKKAKYGCRLKYCIPKDAPEFAFHSIRNARITVDYKNGTRVNFMGCYPLKIGSKTFGKEEVKYDITFSAAERDPKLQ